MTSNGPVGVSGESVNPLPSTVAPQVTPDTSIPSDGNKRTNSSSGRKERRRSIYKFPAYDFKVALEIAGKVEDNGGGTLSEETLAVSLGLSRSSSGFRLKILAARNFNLLVKRGASLSTTSIAKAILKPTSEEDANRGYQDSFLSIQLFKAVAERYRDQRLPDSQTLRNVLEREFHVDPKRVQQAERVLIDSARFTHLLEHRNDGTYLNTSEGEQSSDFEPEADTDFVPQWTGANAAPLITGDRNPRPPQNYALENTWTFSLEEIGQLNHEDFEVVWHALGIVVKARSARLKSTQESRALESASAMALRTLRLSAPQSPYPCPPAHRLSKDNTLVSHVSIGPQEGRRHPPPCLRNLPRTAASALA